MRHDEPSGVFLRSDEDVASPSGMRQSEVWWRSGSVRRSRMSPIREEEYFFVLLLYRQGSGVFHLGALSLPPAGHGVRH